MMRGALCLFVSGLLILLLGSCHVGPTSEGHISAPTTRLARSTIPACRVDAELGRRILPTAKLALEAVRQHHGLKFRDVGSSGSAEVIELVVVRDVLADQVDETGCAKPNVHGLGPNHTVLPDREAVLDATSVRGVCVAETERVMCSSGAIAALLEDGHDPNPTVFFLLAHEFGHVALGHTGADDAHVEAIRPRAPEREKVQQLQRACRRDDVTLAQEKAADDLALKAATSAFQREPLLGKREPRPAIAQNFEAVYAGTLRLQRWLAVSPGQGLGHSGATYFCEVLADQSSRELPFYGGGHPRRWTRLSALMETAANAAAFDADGRENTTDLGALGGNRLTDSLMALAQEDMVSKFCQDVNAYEAKQLNCEGFQRPAMYDATPLTKSRAGNAAAPPVTVTLATPALSPAARTALEKHSVANLLHVKAYETYRGKEQALKGQQSIEREVEALLRSLERWTASVQAVWLHEHHTDIQANSSFGQDEFSIGFELWGILRAPRALGGSDLGKADGSLRVELASEQWDKALFTAVLYLPQKAPENGERTKDELAVSVRPSTLDTLLHFDAAASGHPGQLSPAVRELAEFAFERMVKSERAVRSSEPAARAVLIARLGDVFEHMDIATNWSELRSDGARSRSEAELSGMIESAYSYGSESRALSAGELADLFGSGAGEGSVSNRLVQQGLAYRRGEGVLQSDDRAAASFKQACDTGSPVGCGYYGGMLLKGLGTTAAPQKAVKMLRDACTAAAQNACARLGTVYMEGLGSMPQDGAKAQALLTGACKANDAYGCMQLGVLYDGEAGIEPDGWLSAMYLQRACDGGLKESCFVLATVLMLGKSENALGPRADRPRAQALLSDACEDGLAEACNQLGQGYLGGLFDPLDSWGEPNVAKSEPILRRGCDLGSGEACYLDATAMVKIGLLQTDARVRAQRKRACELGYTKACEGLN